MSVSRLPGGPHADDLPGRVRRRCAGAVQRLTSAVFDALVRRVVTLVQEPWDVDPMTPGDDPAYRQATFGEGYGLLSFHVDDATELIRIFNIAWIG
jgi:hypothetical protein